MTHENWNRHIRDTLKRYDEALLRQVAHNLCKPRNQWPFDELLDRLVAALNNAAMVDRRLRELPAACRQILSAIGHSRQYRWPLGTLIEMLAMLGQSDGLAPVVTLLESGLFLPELFPLGTEEEQGKVAARIKIRNFESWLTRTEPMPILLALPLVTQRTLGEDLGITCPEAPAPEKAQIHEADGLDWPLRLAVLWQQTLGAPLRRTQQGDFFKRDYDKLQNDPLSGAAPTDTLVPIPDPAFFTAALGTATGLLEDRELELHTRDFPASWKEPLSGLLTDLWTKMPQITWWNPAQGYVAPGSGHPYPSVYWMALLLMGRLPADRWTSAEAIEEWIAGRHPFWLGRTSETLGIPTFLLGIAYSLRLVQAIKGPGGNWLIRLSPLGRWVMNGADKPPALPSFKQTLLVQPNLEILAYRQGLTPELIVSLSKIGTWKGLGPACTLLLEPSSVYRALEMGESQTSIMQLLEGHGMKALPATVTDALKTWAGKRERISVYTAGAIFEFASSAEMNDAIARGLPAVRLTDRLAIVANESAIDDKHFRLTGTRDYTLAAEKCVDIEADGVTLSVDLARSDLLLDTELQRFAEPIARPGAQGRRYYHLTPATITAARLQGVTLTYLDSWFQQRTGLPIAPAARLLISGPEAAPLELRRQLILHVGSEAIADGLQQWPGTHAFVVARVGPAALVVEEKDVAKLTERLKELGMSTRFEG